MYAHRLNSKLLYSFNFQAHLVVFPLSGHNKGMGQA